MKKILFHFIFLVPLWGFANSVRIKIINNSNTAFTLTNNAAKKGKFCVGDIPTYTTTINPGVWGEYYSAESCGATGVDGFVEYTATKDGKTYQLYIGFDNPFIGDNEYDPKVSYPFFIKHISGGDGSDVFITYEITGGPAPVPPPAPLVLPAKGNRIISGSFIWDADITGMPSTEEWRSAFSVIAKAPKYLKLNNDNTGNDTYGNQRGSFEELQTVGTVVFSQENNEVNNINPLQTTIAGSKRIIYYRILYLPEGVPVSIHAEPGVAWIPGINSTSKPDKPYSEYIAYCIEKNKTKAGVNYFVEAAWFYSNNAGTGNCTTDNTAALKILSGKQVKPSGVDIVFGNGGYDNRTGKTGNGISKVPLSGNKSSTPLNRNNGTGQNPSANTGNQLKTNLPAQQRINVKQKAINKNGIQ